MISHKKVEIPSYYFARYWTLCNMLKLSAPNFQLFVGHLYFWSSVFTRI